MNKALFIGIWGGVLCGVNAALLLVADRLTTPLAADGALNIFGLATGLVMIVGAWRAIRQLPVTASKR